MTDFNSIPTVLEEIRRDINDLRKEIETCLHPKEVPKNMSLDQALKFLNEEGYPISKSRLYKLTADRKIPHRKFANRLVFTSRELLLWCDHNSQEVIINKTNKNEQRKARNNR